MPTTGVRAEIHSHSTCSDGSYEPSKVAGLCSESGVALWSLTDHDTCRGCAEAADAAADLGIAFVPGIEMSAFETRSIHVLGYGVDPESDAITSYSERRLAARVQRMKAMVERLDELGVSIEFERVAEVAGKGAMARPHLAQALLDAGQVASIQEAFDRYIADDGPAYVATRWPAVEEAVGIAEDAGGIAVLAHPALYDRDDRIEAWVDAGLAGVEVRHPKHDPEDERRYEDLADRFDLIKTASSDYHGPHHVGADYFGDVEIPRAWAEPLLERLQVRGDFW